MSGSRVNMSKTRHQLAAIMFSDIVGYTSLMGSNEKKAFEILRKNRRIHWHLIKKYNGRLLKEMGDGILAIFSSSTEAVVCALSIQQAARALEIPLRIGIHQGDVVFEKKDVLGDGVNIAARIQSLADTHGIVISGNVYKDVRNKEGLKSESMGEKSLKGVAEKTHIYRIWSSDDALLDIFVDTGELIRPLGMNRVIPIGTALLLFLLGFTVYLSVPVWSSDSEKSILVLPFDNHTGSDTNEYFVASMHDALTTELGTIAAFRVLSQSTARAYKTMGVPLSQIAKEQDVDYVVEGSLLCLGESMCFQPKLISIQGEEKQIWSGNYTNDISEVLNLYHEVTKEVTREINVMLTREEEQKLEERKIVNPEAYRLYLQGRQLWILEGEENLAKSIEYYERALEIDPDFALAYVGMAITYTSFGWYIYEPNTIALPKAEAAARKALELDNTIGEAHTELALSKLVLNWDWQGSEESFKRAIDLNPSDARAHNMYA
ncbi:MAG: adenylate/guanylate cyclase domain-containing protein, partial [Saprospiraceae bacterium]|nr:adenylate/guanylate cyclase domain-containing protein [Saprospiraceae bacterium]